MVIWPEYLDGQYGDENHRENLFRETLFTTEVTSRIRQVSLSKESTRVR